MIASIPFGTTHKRVEYDPNDVWFSITGGAIDSVLMSVCDIDGLIEALKQVKLEIASVQPEAVELPLSPEPAPPVDFGTFIVWGYFQNQGYQPVKLTNLFDEARAAWLETRKRTDIVLMTINLGRLEE